MRDALAALGREQRGDERGDVQRQVRPRPVLQDPARKRHLDVQRRGLDVAEGRSIQSDVGVEFIGVRSG
eukprot:17050-Pelagococcus_subviridis.AAC.1